jgi:serine/threonine-protein kinase
MVIRETGAVEGRDIGKYRVIARLGAGGMAEVFIACVRGLGGFSKLAVLKVLRPNLAEDADFVRMFLDEARLAARLNHPNIVQTNEIGQDGTTYFLAMEYLQGQPMQQLLHRARKGENVPLPVVLTIFSQTLSGLHAAHTAKDFNGQPLGIVHRDISPQNVMVTYDGQVKLLDFGIARANERSRNTQAGIIKGKVRYMSPEQATGHELDARADIYSMGVMLWEALAGVRMWSDLNDNQVLYKLIQKKTAPSLPPSVPQGLARITEKALASNAADRYPTARDMQVDLDKYCEELGYRVGNDEIGRLVATLFEAERRELSRKIEGQIAAIDNLNTEQFRAQKIPEIELSSVSASSASLAGGDAISLTGRTGRTARRRAATARKNGALVALVLGSVAILAIGVWAYHSRSSTPAAQASVAASGTPLRIGMSAAFQGPSAALGVEMRRGILAYLNSINAAGGIRGRRIELDSRNDSYEPTLTRENMKSLLDVKEESTDRDTPDKRGDKSVFAILGNVGTPGMVEAAPMAMKNNVIFFAPFTGAQKYLRDGTNSRYVFNYRASYFEETRAIVEYLFKLREPRIPDYSRLLAFTQTDAYGDAGYSGLENAYNTEVGPLPAPGSIKRVGYKRNDVKSTAPAIAAAETWMSDLLAKSRPRPEHVAVIMVDTYAPGSEFIRAVKDWTNESADRAMRLHVDFLHVSFVGSEALAAALSGSPSTYKDATDPTGQRRKSYAEGVFVTEVVPPHDSDAPGVKAYRNDIKTFDQGALTFTSLEGHIAARLLAAGIDRAGPNATTDKVIEALEGMQEIDLGIGGRLGFSPNDHQASHKVWGMRLDDNGAFALQWTWTRQNGVQVDH